MAKLGDAALLEVRRAETRAELLFAHDPGVRESLDAILAAESACCPFLEMRVNDRGNSVLTLEVEAPAGAETVLSGIVEAFGGHASAAA
jgi:hypothetical protein